MDIVILEYLESLKGDDSQQTVLSQANVAVVDRGFLMLEGLLLWLTVK
ncbi:hypothetical protein [Reinekea thalattae]|nr:hypothetical protein [Reinekea thalattae]